MVGGSGLGELMASSMSREPFEPNATKSSSLNTLTFGIAVITLPSPKT
mgnify:CR=1 FL=1